MSREALELANFIRQQAEGVSSRKPKSRMAVISSYNPATHAIKVTYQPEGVESAWMPLAALGVGNGFGLLSGPNLGDQVKVDFTDGDYAAPKVVGRFFSNLAVPPAVPAGEHWFVHSTGALIKLSNDGKVTIKDAGGSTVVMNGDGTGTMSFASGLTITADTQITGQLTVTKKITGQGGMAVSGGSGATVAGNMAITGGNVTADGIGLKTHTHSDPQGGTVGAAVG